MPGIWGYYYDIGYYIPATKEGLHSARTFPRMVSINAQVEGTLSPFSVVYDFHGLVNAGFTKAK